jgi:large subunit ribosomal protein L29
VTARRRRADGHREDPRALHTELENALLEAKQDLWQARFALSTRQLKDYSTIPQTRRTIARILTVQRERKLGRTA